MNEQEWKTRYKARLISQGLDEKFVEDYAKWTDVLLDESPEVCADDELLNIVT